MIYQILGWPRSRTAWLANFLTYGNSFCFHEGIASIKQGRLRTVDEYRKLLKLYERRFKFVGDANTFALLRQKYVIPGAKVVIIERDRKEIENSCYAMGYYINLPEVIEYPYNENLIVKYEDIDSRLEEIWNFCLPGEHYLKPRELLLKNLRVEVTNINSYLNLKGV